MRRPWFDCVPNPSWLVAEFCDAPLSSDGIRFNGRLTAAPRPVSEGESYLDVSCGIFSTLSLLSRAHLCAVHLFLD